MSTLPCYLILFTPKYSSQNPILEHPQPKFLPFVSDQASDLHKTGKKFCIYLNFTFMGCKLKDKKFCTE
jgi:hypothetical protein